jgi:hypothetical protein
MALGAEFHFRRDLSKGMPYYPCFSTCIKIQYKDILPRLQELEVWVVYHVDGVLYDKPMQTFTHCVFVYVLLSKDGIALLKES